MKLIVLYRPNSEHASILDPFLHEIAQRYPQIKKIEHLDLNTRDGAAMASIYDVVDYPGIVAATDDGVPQEVWQGKMLPLMSDVASHFNEQ